MQQVAQYQSFRLQVLLEHQVEQLVQDLLYFFSNERNSQKIIEYKKKKKKRHETFLYWLKVNSIALKL